LRIRDDDGFDDGLVAGDAGDADGDDAAGNDAGDAGLVVDRPRRRG
jgi:hypothetical protein